MLTRILLCLGVLLAILAIAASFVPLVETGAWWVRAWDFPVAQLAAVVPIIAVGAIVVAVRRGWNIGGGILVAGLVAASVWNLARVAPFTPLARVDVPDAAEFVGEGLSLVASNVLFKNRDTERLLDLVERERPDLLLLVEIDERWRAALEPLRSEYPELIEEVRPEGLGIQLWSRLPLHGGRVRYLMTDERPSIHAAVELPSGRRVRFAGVHPTPPALALPNERTDSRVRDGELMLLASEIEKVDGEAWIVAGDLNDVAWSHTTKLFLRESRMLDPRVGRGLFNTYPARLPFLRYPLDHVFVSDDFTLVRMRVLEDIGSDHLPVSIEVVLAPEVADEHADEPSAADEEEVRELVEEGREDVDAGDDG